MMKNFLNELAMLTIFALMIGGCESVFRENDDVMIRIQNNSTYPMEEIIVNFPEEEVLYGDISAGQKSTYKEVTKAYRYAYIETVVQDKKLVLQPIDYVGESLLDPGKHTYELNIDKETFNSENFRYALSLQLVEDE